MLVEIIRYILERSRQKPLEKEHSRAVKQVLDAYTHGTDEQQVDADIELSKASQRYYSRTRGHRRGSHIKNVIADTNEVVRKVRRGRE